MNKIMALLIIVQFFGVSVVAKPETDPKELEKVLDAMDKMWIEGQCFAKITMTVQTQHYRRNLKLDYWGKGKEHTLIKITYPPKEKGVTTLKIKEDVYNYIPKVARTIKISQALRSSSWMGSHFTNDDLIRSTHLKDDFVATVTQRQREQNNEIWTIEAIPKPETVTLWKKLILVFNRSALLPVRQDFYDENSELIRSITYHEIKKLGEKRLPSKIKVTPTTPDKKGEYTELVYESIDRNMTIDDSVFSLTHIMNQ